MRILYRPLVLVLLLALSGCMDSDGGGFSGDYEELETDDEDFPGLQVEGILEGDDDEVRIDAVARNDGSRTYKVSNICVAPWSESMTRGGEPVLHREPMFACAAFGLRDFEPGERIPYDLSWNGTLWDEGSGDYGPAPSGAYVWSVEFTVYRGGEGPEFEAQATLDLDFHVTVG